MLGNRTSEAFRRSMMTAAVLSAALCLLLFVPSMRSQAQPPSGQQPQDQPMDMEHHHHDGMSMPMDEPMDAAAKARMEAKLLADKRESEFNHHLAGFFVIVAGVFMLFQEEFRKRWSAATYVWPATFLASGLFLLVWSDTELWPFGQRQWLEALKNNREVLQHKTFAILLLALGIIELLRANGRLKALWSAWVFPAVAVVGSFLLLFHEHEGGMQGANHMAVMARIQSEHFSFAATGFGIGLVKGLSETRMSWRGILTRLWPLLMMVLGVLLLFYRE